MPLKQLTAAFLTLLLIATAFGQSAVSASSGYELYSWKIKGHWYYSLFPRGGGSRTFEEITTNRAIRRDSSGLESELRKLPKASDVFWMSDAPNGAHRSESRSSVDIKHPSRKRIEHIKGICDKLGIRLRLT